jgi:hypothetical protein
LLLAAPKKEPDAVPVVDHEERAPIAQSPVKKDLGASITHAPRRMYDKADARAV